MSETHKSPMHLRVFLVQEEKHTSEKGNSRSQLGLIWTDVWDSVLTSERAVRCTL